MSLGTTSLHSHNPKIGSCPHGLPPGACPICNGMAGGNSTTKRDTPRNVGEMTYNQCAAIGAMLKAQKHARQQSQAVEQSRLEALAEFQKNISNVHQRLTQYTTIISNNLPVIISRPINFVLNNIIGKTLYIIQNISITMSKLIQTINSKIADITDKLTAIFGEIKTSINEKLSKFISDTKKKLKSIFFVFGIDDIQDEDKKIDEAKRTFELKTFINKLYSKIKKDFKEDAH